MSNAEQQKNHQHESNGTKTTIIWMFAAIISVVIVVTKAILSFTSSEAEHSKWSLIVVIGLVISFYGLFLLEGLIVASIQFKDSDSDKLSAYLKARYDDKFSADMTLIANDIKQHYDNFVAGRSLLSVFAIVCIAYCLDALETSRHDGIFTYIDYYYPPISDIIYSSVSSNITTFVIATFLPYWISQLLPHYASEHRAIEFMNLPLAKMLTHFVKGLGNYGVGSPSIVILHYLQRKFGWFTGSENLGVGDVAIYDAMVGYFGLGVFAREITIAASNTLTDIVDRNIYEFRSGEHSEIRHAIRITKAQTARKYPSWKTSQIPEGITHILNPSRAILQQLSKMPQKTGDGNHEFVIVTSRAVLDAPLPRPGVGHDKAGLEASYTDDPLHLGEQKNEFVFDISKPTRRFTAVIKRGEGVFIPKPKCTLHAADELHALTEQEPLENVVPNVQPKSHHWEITLDYPPLGSRVKIELDAQSSPDQTDDG